MRTSEFISEATRLQRALAGTVAAASLGMVGKGFYDLYNKPKEPTKTVQVAQEKLRPEIKDMLLAVAKKANIKGKELAHLMSQASHETLGFTRSEEDLEYKTADRLVKVFPSIFKNEQQARPYVNNPEKLANHVYANRYGNGDEASGDGWKYRGRGPLMITFKANYAALEKATGLPLVDNPEKAAEPEHAAQIAAAYWILKVRHRMGDSASLRDVTRIINPGMQDVERREKEYEKYSTQVDEDADDEQGEEGEESHKHNLIPFPKGTVKVGVSDVYDWYKLGTHINDLDDADPEDFGQGPPQTMLSFGSEEEEHRYMRDLKRLGMDITDLDEGKIKTRLDPKCWKGKKIGNPKTKVKGGVRVNNCVPMEETVKSAIARSALGLNETKEADKTEYLVRAVVQSLGAKRGNYLIRVNASNPNQAIIIANKKAGELGTVISSKLVDEE